jgi:hypothetical protein
VLVPLAARMPFRSNKMQVLHALDDLPKSIFLAGPTPRDVATPSWRPEAVRVLDELGFDGTVFVPEPQNRRWADSYDDQVTWEWEAIHQATVTVFWIPRELSTMPAFTTNVEFGLTVASSRIIVGSPAGTPKMGYLHALARRYNVPIVNDFRRILQTAIERCSTPFEVGIR